MLDLLNGERGKKKNVFWIVESCNNV